MLNRYPKEPPTLADLLADPLLKNIRAFSNVLAGTALPRTVRVAEVHPDVGGPRQLPMSGHLLALVVGQRLAQRRAEDRVTLAALRQQGYSLRHIAGVLGRSAATLSREVRRNSQAGQYLSSAAQQASLERRVAARAPVRLDPDGPLWPLITHLLGWLWSPQQIARTLRDMWPDQPELHVSHETIYNAIYAHPKGELRKELIACLRQGRSTRKSRSAGTDRRGQIPEMVSIHVRPPEVNDRVMPGHWEGDLIKGAGNKSAVGVLVERSTRLVLLAKMPDATAESALAAFTVKLNSIAAQLPVSHLHLHTLPEGQGVALQI